MSKYLFNIEYINLCLKLEDVFSIREYKNLGLKSFIHRGEVKFTLKSKDMDRLLIYRDELLKRGLI